MLTVVEALSQEPKANYVYTQAISIDNSLVTDTVKKLASLYKLKATAEKGNFFTDSGYMVTLVKIAKYETLANKNYPLAVQYNLQALNLLRQTRQPVSDNITVNAYYNQGSYYESILLHSKALAYFDTVVLLCKQHDPGGYVIASRYAKTIIYNFIGDYQKATDESTMGINNALQSSDSSSYLSFLNFRAYSYLYEDLLEPALLDTKTVIAIAQKQNNLYELANAYKIMAIISDRKKNYKEAAFFFKATIAIRPHLDDEYETVANDYNDFGNFYLNSLNDYKKAKEDYAITIQYGNKCDSLLRKLVLFMADINLAEVAIKQHLYKDAIGCYDLALNNISIKTSNSILYKLSSNELTIISNRNVLFYFLFGRTELLLLLYKETHQPSYLQACLQTAMLTDTLITQTRHENLSEGSKLYWRNETRNFFSNVVEACYISGNTGMAFYFIEKSRAVLLNDKWNELGAATHLPAAEKLKEKDLQIKIIEQQQLLSTLQADSKHYTQTKDSLVQTKDELEHFIRALEKKYPAYYQYKYADSAFSIQVLQQFLSANHQSFVHYFMNDTVLYALAVSPNTTKFIKLAANDFDSRQLIDFLRICSDKNALNQGFTSYAALAKEIYTKLFKPLDLPKGNVAICTDNFFIPFEALCTDANGKNFLLNDYNFSYVYSARSLMKPFTNNSTAGNFIGFAPVSFAQNLQLMPLTQSAAALSNTAKFYNNYKLLTQHEATRGNFFRNASDYSVITILSHAQADTSGQEPRLYMQDSVIYLSELQKLKNPSAQFVLLSACQTNIGKTATGEGIYSLARGFALAGIPAVSATLWKADEQTIYAISGKFNEYLAGGMNKSEALQKAKTWFIKKNEHSALSLPFYWANMVLIGSSQPVVFSKETYSGWWIGMIIFIVLLIAFTVYLKLKNNQRIKRT